MLRTRAVTPVAAGLAALVWLPFVDRPATPDEGGYLLLASQWRVGGGGSSLYGAYWVDRPPLLVTLFQLADALGPSRQGAVVALRLLGVVSVVVCTLLAGRLGRLVAPAAEPYAAMLTAALLTTPLYGGLDVNGELLAAPFLLGGLIALVRAGRSSAGAARWWLLAGAAGAAAALVKQSQVDLVVVGGVVVLLRWRSLGPRPALRAAALLLGGAAAVTALTLGWAALHGTYPGELWSAVVAFRFRAAATIGTASGHVTGVRALGLAGAFVGSGTPLLLYLLARTRRRVTWPGPGPDPRVLALVLLAWELFGVLFGGSYWLHYLVGLVPGLVIATACWFLPAASPVRVDPHRLAGPVTGFVVVSALVSVVVFAAVGGRTPEDDIGAYLRTHGRPGDTVVVGFGRPHIVYDAGMSSPYDELWSLPVRVRDPHLARLTAILAGPDRPDWIVIAGEGLQTWGITDVASASAEVRAHYVEVKRFTGYRVFHETGPAAAAGGATGRAG